MLCQIHVTLHVSVWVEIYTTRPPRFKGEVTLHVSVWVEIISLNRHTVCMNCHAPRERVSWNSHHGILLFYRHSHAPRERVSWNAPLPTRGRTCGGHAPRERVSWNKINPYLIGLRSGHAPRERVSWNTILLSATAKATVTLHVSVWVEMKLPITLKSLSSSRSTWACELKYVNGGGRSVENYVTLHVSVWVEMYWIYSRLTVKQSRSTWACELKSIVV